MIRITKPRLLLFVTALVFSSALIRAAYQKSSMENADTAPGASTLAAWAPQGPLLAIEARDFSALLRDWSSSEQQRTWLASENYGAFSRSRLFSRLGEAQEQFAASAGLPPDMSFLTQIAGDKSFFALYDIGKLEFLYITHMPASAAEQTQLLEYSKFETRKAGAETFFVRTQGEPKRTVAFAVHGDYLLLATREDLLAQALFLMQDHGSLDLQQEHWYAAAMHAASPDPGDLRMALNLDAIVPSPYFRSYWVQQNLSEMKQYSAAVTDLYRTSASFREERALLRKSEIAGATVDLGPVLEYLPTSAGVYRATAQPATDQMLSALREKLLFRDISQYRNPRSAPAADMAEQTVGSAADLETRIDTPPPPRQPLAEALAPLRVTLGDAHVASMLVTSSTEEASDQLFLPIHSTIVLAASQPWKTTTLQSDLIEALRFRLTASSNGLQWQQRTQANVTWFELSGLQPFAFATRGNICILASDSATLLQALAHTPRNPRTGQRAAVVAGFSHTTERAHFGKITSLLDHALSTASTPPFLSKDIRSLSDTFQSLDSETFVEQPGQNNVVHQTVVYKWRR